MKLAMRSSGKALGPRYFSERFFMLVGMKNTTPAGFPQDYDFLRKTRGICKAQLRHGLDPFDADFSAFGWPPLTMVSSYAEMPDQACEIGFSR